MSEDRVGLQLKQLLIWVFVCVVIWLFDSIGWFGWLKTGIEKGLSPLEQLSYSWVRTLRSPIEMVRFYRSGTERIIDLEARLAEKLVMQAQVDELIRENQSLREQLDAPLPGEWQLVPATVLGYQQGSLIINAGSVEGIAEGMTVVYKEMYVGRVSHVSSATSEVVLLTHSDSKVAAKVTNRNLNGLIINDKGLIILDQILQGSEVQEGEVVVTSGTDGVTPLLTIGRITQVVSDQSDIFKQVLITPAVTPEQLSTVFIITSYEEIE